jgi:mRNA interferase MazF
MSKDFSKWTSVKSTLNEALETPLFQDREVWWCSIGANIGVEIDGKNDSYERPVIVFKKFNKNMFLGLPVTSVIKEARPFYFSYTLKEQEFTAVLSQMRTISSKRLIRRSGKMSDSQFSELSKALINLITNENPLAGISSGA